MRWVRRILIGVLAVVVVLAGIGLLLPRVQHVERSRSIAAPADRLFALVAAPRQWNAWSPWAARDPAMRIDYRGPQAGAGAGWSWQSATEGSGSMAITAAEPPSRIAYRIEFADMGSSADGAFRFAPEGGGTRVTWSFDADMGWNPLSRWFGLMLDRWVGADFEAGLAGLERAAR